MGNEILNPSIVRVLLRERRSPVGCAVLVGDHTAVTCAHVVVEALGPGCSTVRLPDGPVTLEFPFVAAGRHFQARVGKYIPCGTPSSSEGGDVVALHLDSLPTGASPTPLVAADLSGHPVVAFGLDPTKDHMGVWSSPGVVSGKVACGWYQIQGTGDQGYAIQPGFSGGPIWDERLDRLVGITTHVDKKLERRVAFIIPANILTAVLPRFDAEAFLRSWQGQKATFVDDFIASIPQIRETPSELWYVLQGVDLDLRRYQLPARVNQELTAEVRRTGIAPEFPEFELKPLESSRIRKLVRIDESVGEEIVSLAAKVAGNLLKSEWQKDLEDTKKKTEVANKDRKQPEGGAIQWGELLQLARRGATGMSKEEFKKYEFEQNVTAATSLAEGIVDAWFKQPLQGLVRWIGGIDPNQRAIESFRVRAGDVYDAAMADLKAHLDRLNGDLERRYYNGWTGPVIEGEVATVRCPTCGRSSRVPLGSGERRLTCPGCAAS